MISAPNEPFIDSTVSRVYLYYGGSEISSLSDSILTFPDNEFGFNLKNLGDINNDGTFDFAITSQANCIVYFECDNRMATYFYGSGHGIGGNGDLNNDGIMDIIIGDPSYKDDVNYIGCIKIYIGENEFSFNTDYNNIGEQYFSLYSQFVDFVGDYNGDGYDDIFVVATTFREDGKEIGKLYLYSYKNISGISEPKNKRINNFKLYPNYPNPFNSSTVILFHLKQASDITINVYDIQCKLIKTLYSGVKQAGTHNLAWNGKTDFGNDAASGIYFVLMKQRNNSANVNGQKIILLK